MGPGTNIFFFFFVATRGVYTQNLWSFLDVTFVCIYSIYVALRIHGFRLGIDRPGQQAFDVLALAAPVLVPRVAFTLLSDNLVLLCLRSMMVDFFFLTALSAWCFLGFLLALLWLGEGAHPVLYVFPGERGAAREQAVKSDSVQDDIEMDDIHLVWAGWHGHPAFGKAKHSLPYPPCFPLSAL